MPSRIPALVLLASVSAVALAADAPRLNPRPVHIHDLPTLTHADALRLAGREVLYRVELDSRTEEYEGRILVDCTSSDAIHRTAWLVPFEGELPETFTVRARLGIIVHPASWGFPELIEYRLEDAVRQ